MVRVISWAAPTPFSGLTYTRSRGGRGEAPAGGGLRVSVPPRRSWSTRACRKAAFEAKARFSELFRRVRSEGPQRVVKQRGEAVVVVPAEAFDRATECTAQPASLVDFFRAAPTGGRRWI